MLRISWTEYVTNETVLRKMNINREILGIIIRQKTSYMEDIYREGDMTSKTAQERMLIEEKCA